MVLLMSKSKNMVALHCNSMNLLLLITVKSEFNNV